MNAEEEKAQPELKMETEKKMCSNCGLREVYPVGRRMDWCEPCMWESVQNQ